MAMASENGALSGRSLATFALGAVAGVVASRVLPPVLATAVGSAKVAAGQDPLAPFVADHRHFASLLRQMEGTGVDQRLQRMQLLLRLKRALAAHAMAEEDVMYPVLHDQTFPPHSIDHLYADHAGIKIMLFRLEEMPKDDPEWAAQVRALRRLIEAHARQEEEVQFPRLRQLLSGRDMARLSRNLQRERALTL